MPIEFMFCFICTEQCIKIISSCKTYGLFSSVFKKIKNGVLHKLHKWIKILKNVESRFTF